MTAVPKDMLSYNNVGVPATVWCKAANPGTLLIYECKFCLYFSSQKGSIMAHLRMVHLGLVVTCKFCHKTCYKGGNWLAHMLMDYKDVKVEDWTGLPDPFVTLK